MFYNQLSKVLEINNGVAKLDTQTILTKEDAETVNSIKGEGTVKEGDFSNMVHSFSCRQLSKVIASSDELLTCNGVKREGESCTKNNNCIYPDCKLAQIHPNFMKIFVKEYKKNNIIEEVDVVYKEVREERDGSEMIEGVKVLFEIVSVPILTDNYVQISSKYCTHSKTKNPKEHVENKCSLCNKPYKPEFSKDCYIHTVSKKCSKEQAFNVIRKFTKDKPLYRGIQILDSDIEKWVDENYNQDDNTTK